ncbi:MAG: hypothetical protein ACPGPC_00775 [Alphaproteobacteria bacterium]
MAGIDAASAISSAKAKSSLLRAQAAIQERPAQVQVRQAEFLNQQAMTCAKLAERERQLNIAQNRLLRSDQSRGRSRNQAVLAARGIDPSAGSALLIQEDIAARNEFESLLARAQGLQSSIALDQQAHASQFSAQQMLGDADISLSGAQISRNSARSARQQGLLSAVGSLAKGTNNLARQGDF